MSQGRALVGVIRSEAVLFCILFILGIWLAPTDTLPQAIMPDVTRSQSGW